jgi:hypothetical protein
VIVSFVPDPDMIIIFGFVTILVIYDFWEAIGRGSRSRRD